jgi:hypothetical protein
MLWGVLKLGDFPIAPARRRGQVYDETAAAELCLGAALLEVVTTRPPGAGKIQRRLSLAFDLFLLISPWRWFHPALKPWNTLATEYSIALQGLKQAVYLH